MAEEGDKTYTQEQLDVELADSKTKLVTSETKISEFRETNIDLMKRLKKLDGIDPNEYRDMQTRLAELEQKSKADKAGITKEELDKLRADVRTDLRKEFEPVLTERDTLKGEVRTLRLDNVIKSEMGEAGVRAERLDALFRLTGERFELTEDGAPMLKNHPGTEISKYIGEELIQEYPEFFVSSGSSGGGASKSAGGAGGASKTIPSGDDDAFLANLDEIAEGKVKVDVEVSQ